MIREIRWSQWSPNGMMGSGVRDYDTLMKWMREIGKNAHEYLKHHANQHAHAVYGRKMYDEEDQLIEIRFYCDSFMTDEELENFATKNPKDILYVIHRG